MGDLPILRYAAPIGKTRDQMRSWLRNTDEGRALYNHGDCRLVWVNEGDLDRVQFLTDIAATRETDLRAEVERLTEERDRLQHDNDMSLHVVDYQEKDIERLRAEVERLTAANREAVMQSLADLGQAQEALDRAIAAEAEAARLRALLDEALNLTVRGRRLDGIARRQNHLDAAVNPEEWQASGRFDDFVARHNATREPWEQIEVRSLTPQLWTEDQFQRDLHDWETRARATLAKIGGQ